MNYEEYTMFINIVLNESKSKMELLEQNVINRKEEKIEEIPQDEIDIQEDESPEIATNKVSTLSFKYLFTYIIVMMLSLFFCAMTYKVFGFAFLIPAFVITGAYLYKYTRRFIKQIFLFE